MSSPLYETVREQPDPEAIEAAQTADYVTFTSSSTVRNLLEAIGDRFPRQARIVSIGPVTSETAREAGLEVHVEAERHEPSRAGRGAARRRGAFDLNADAVGPAPPSSSGATVGFMAGRLIGGFVTLVVLVGAAAVSGNAQGARPGEERLVSCSFNPAKATAAVRVRQGKPVRLNLPPGFPENLEEALTVVLPTNVAVQRRGDGIAIIEGDFPFDTPVPCAQGPVTVDNTDRLRIAKGKAAESIDLTLDLAYGFLEPGVLDEGDGSSEIEIHANLGRGLATVRFTREQDHVTAVRSTSGIEINFNALETLPDADLVLDPGALPLLLGGGSDDVLNADADSTSTTPSGGIFFLFGGQGADAINGSSTTDYIVGGPGADVVEAGPGNDYVEAFGRAPDTIDCGPGQDDVFVRDDANRLRRCERVTEVRVRDIFRRPMRAYLRARSR